MNTAYPLFRFVQVRRAGRPEEDEPHDTPPWLEAIGDFTDDLLPEGAEALQKGDRRRLATLMKEWLEAIGSVKPAFRARLVLLTRRATIDDTLTMAELRAVPVARGTDLTDKQLQLLVRELVSTITVSRWLDRGSPPRLKSVQRLLRGVVLLRLIASPAENKARVAELLDQITMRLPHVKSRVDGGDGRADLSALRNDTMRINARAQAMGLKHVTLDSLTKVNLGDLSTRAHAVHASAKKMGMPAAMSLESFSDALSADWALSDAYDKPIITIETTPVTLPVLDGRARVLGRGDLMLVRTEFLRYEIGEIAYIENVLKSEFRHRKNVIDTATSERIIETQKLFSETSSELTSTERTDLQRAAETVNNTSTSLSAGMNVSGGFGPISVGLDINASRSTSTTESNSSATSYSKEVTEKASEIVRNESSSKVTTTNRTRVTETNRHDFDARASDAHVRGIYRWVNKVDRAQLYNYGERLLLEFIVPEPAAQYVYLNTTATASGSDIPAPAPLDFSARDLTDATYRGLAERYGVVGLDAPPPELVAVSTTLVVPAAKSFEYPPPEKNKDPNPEASQPREGYAVASGEVALPEGYEPVEARITAVFGGGDRPKVTVSVGARTGTITGTDNDALVLSLAAAAPGALPITVGVQQKHGVAVAVRVEGRRTAGARETWQLRTFDVIQQAYLSLQSTYESQASAVAMRQTYSASTPSPVNRAVEQRELKRCCQSVFTGQEFALFGSVRIPGAGAPVNALPDMNLHEAWIEANVIQFVEEALECDLMAYVFYPYQWAGRDRWSELSLRSSGDPLHQAFLQAGAARIVIPVREGYERRVSRYLKTGRVPHWGPDSWRGKPCGHAAIDELIADANDRPGDEVAIDSPWEVTSTTSLIYLQEDAELNPAAS